MEHNAAPNNKTWDVIALDFGTGFSSMVVAKVVDGAVSTAVPFWDYDGDPGVRQGRTSEVPSVCGHIRRNPEKSKALYGFQVGAATDTEKAGVEVVYNLKAGLYSKNEGNASTIQKLIDLARDVPYLVDVYKKEKTALQHNPETWLAADFIRYLVKLADSPKAKWQCSIPSNYSQNSKRLYIEMLNLAGLKGRVELSAEVVAAFEWFTRQEKSLVADGDTAIAIDCGAGTTDFACFWNKDGIYEEIMRSDAISMGPNNLIQLAEEYILKKCGKDQDLRRAFNLKLFEYRRQFTERMHVFNPSKATTDNIDHYVDVGNTKIGVSSGKMAEWFAEYTGRIDGFLTEKIKKYSLVYEYPWKPSNVFLFGGASQALPVVALLEEKMKHPLFRPTNSRPTD